MRARRAAGPAHRIRAEECREPGLRVIIPIIDVLRRVSLRIVTMPIQSQGTITRDNVSVDVSAVAYFRVVDAVKSVVAIENVHAAINQITQTTLRKVVGRHTLDETLSETDRINADIREILDVTTVEPGPQGRCGERGRSGRAPDGPGTTGAGRPQRTLDDVDGGWGIAADINRYGSVAGQSRRASTTRAVRWPIWVRSAVTRVPPRRSTITERSSVRARPPTDRCTSSCGGTAGCRTLPAPAPGEVFVEDINEVVGCRTR